MASRKNKWRKRGRLEFRRESGRYHDGTQTGQDVLYVRVKGVACSIVQPFDMASYREQGDTVSVLCGTYRICSPIKAAHYARDYIESKLS